MWVADFFTWAQSLLEAQKPRVLFLPSFSLLQAPHPHTFCRQVSHTSSAETQATGHCSSLGRKPRILIFRKEHLQHGQLDGGSRDVIKRNVSITYVSHVHI